MSFGEQILDLLAGTDEPLRHTGLAHLDLVVFLDALAFADRFHRLERIQIVHLMADQRRHDIVTRTDNI